MENNGWDALSWEEKAQMMRVAVGNGITGLKEIKEAYNSFAEGGGLEEENDFAGGGYKPSERIRDRISRYEGVSMTRSYRDPLSGKMVGPNASFESEAQRFSAVLPEGIREKVLANPELADNLFSYSYNVGAGNFKKRVVPVLEDYYSGKKGAEDVANAMWASGDAKLRGLQKRRAEEKDGVRRALSGIAETPQLTMVPMMGVPMWRNGAAGDFAGEPQNTIVGAQPFMGDNGSPVVNNREHRMPDVDPRRERMENLQRLSGLMAMMGMENPLGGMAGIVNVPLVTLGSMMSYGGNIYAGGGDTTNVYLDNDGYHALGDDNRQRIPLSRYGEYGNDLEPSTWQFVDEAGKIYSPQGTHYGEHKTPTEKGLELVSPEFDLLSLGSLIKGISKRALGSMTQDATKQYSIKDIFSKFKDNNSSVTIEDVNTALKEAAAYKNSPEYKNLIAKARQESTALGFGDFPEETFLSNVKDTPSITFSNRPKGIVGSYTYKTNILDLDPAQIAPFEEVPFHEGLHWQRIGNNELNIGPKYTKWSEAFLAGKQEEANKLFSEVYNSSEEFTRMKMQQSANDYLKHKINTALYPDADPYLRTPGELVVNGLEAGKALGIKPFTEYPGYLEAINYVDKARKYNSYLKDVRAGKEDTVKNFWDILTGQYHPSVIPTITVGGLGTTLFKANNE